MKYTMENDNQQQVKSFYRILEEGIAKLPADVRGALYRPCAVDCVKDVVLTELRRQFEECGCDLDRQYTKYGRSEYFFADVIEPGRVYEVGYPRCLCPQVDAGFVDSAAHCECSRQSILYVLEELLPGVLAEVQPYEAQFGHAIPVFVAGGIYTGADMAHYTKLGAAGVQLATRFIPTYECDASQTYKDVLLAAKPEDVRIIHSPVGMPGRALNTPLVQALAKGKRFAPRHCARCLKTCDPAKVPYCITHALIEAVKGNVEEGLFFCGANVGRLDRMYTVRELMDELTAEWRHDL